MVNNVADRWAFNRFAGKDSGKLSLTVGGVELPVSRFSMSYGVNAIPTAVALVAMGRNASTNKPSAVYALNLDLKQMSPASVYLEGSLGDWSTRGGGQGKSQWPAGKHLLFTGYVSGAPYRRAMGQVYLVINMVQRLVDLSMSACGSRDVVPASPQALFTRICTGNAGEEVMADICSNATNNFDIALHENFSGAVLAMLTAVANNNLIQTHASFDPHISTISSAASNKRALRVLGPFEEWQGIYGGDLQDKYTSAYPLQLQGANAAHVKNSVGSLLSSSLHSTSMWGMLIDALLPVFGMAVIPVNDRAYMVPSLPSSQKEYISIFPEDYVDCDQSCMSQRPLFAVGVESKQNTASLANISSPLFYLGGAFTANVEKDADGVPDGMWMFVSAPGWLDGWVMTDSGASLEADPAVVAAMTAVTNSDDGSPPAVGAPLNRDINAEAGKWNILMNKYAQLFYTTNSLRGRTGTISGKLRFDVAPGSTICVEASSDVFTKGIDKFAEKIFAYVARVTCTIDAEQLSAATTFELTNIRTKTENADPSGRFSMGGHPFFNDYFVGAPLVQSLQVK